jgi:plastocyanin
MKRQIERYDIAITRADAGGFTYSPSTLNVASGDEVSWSSTLGPFAVSFKYATPLPVVTLSSEPDDAGKHAIKARKIRKSAVGHHQYVVALAKTDGPATIVLLDAGCADVVVSNDD